MFIREVLSSTDGRASMSRLLCFMSFFPATWALILLPSEGMLGIYLGAYGVGYLGGKALDFRNPTSDVNK